MAVSSPLALVSEKFGDKEKLVAAVEKLAGEDLWVARTNKNKGLAHVSNSKLLKLHATFTEVKERFGTREKLIDAILEIEKRTKDAGFKQMLSAWPVPRLYDAYKSTAKRHNVVTKSAEGKAARAQPKAEAKPAKAAGKSDKGDKTEKAAKADKPEKKAAKPVAKKSASKA
jgi:hypothetical protein